MVNGPRGSVAMKYGTSSKRRTLSLTDAVPVQSVAGLTCRCCNVLCLDEYPTGALGQATFVGHGICMALVPLSLEHGATRTLVRIPEPPSKHCRPSGYFSCALRMNLSETSGERKRLRLQLIILPVVN